MELNAFILSEMSPRKTNIVRTHLHVDFKKQNKTNTHKKETCRKISQICGYHREQGKKNLEEGAQKVRISDYKINKLLGM